MNRTLPLLLLLVACGESHSRPSPATDSDLEATRPRDDQPFEAPACATEREPECVSDDFRLCPGTSGYAFLRAQTFAEDGVTTAALAAPEAGTICMSGRLAPIADNGGGAALSLFLDERGRANTCIRSAFDARALGISALELSLDQVPDTRLTLSAVVIRKTECAVPFECIEGGFYDLLTPTGEDLVLLMPGVNRAPLDEFIGADSGEPLDGRRLSFFSLYLQATNEPVDFDFCVSQLRFSDAADRTIVPPAR